MRSQIIIVLVIMCNVIFDVIIGFLIGRRTAPGWHPGPREARYWAWREKCLKGKLD